MDSFIINNKYLNLVIFFTVFKLKMKIMLRKEATNK